MEKIQNYRPLQAGRNHLADALYQDAGNAIALIWTNTSSSSGTMTDKVIRVDRFVPDRIAGDYASVVGINIAQSFFGIIL